MYKPACCSILLTIILSFVVNGPLAADSNTIIANGATCTLANAIRSANADSSIGGCSAGSGADRIEMQGDVVLNSAENSTHGVTGLPVITSNITIDGNDNIIRRNTSADDLRLLAVSSSGSLTRDNITLRDGQTETNPLADDLHRAGGAIYVHTNGRLTLNNATVRNNQAHYGGGAIISNNGIITINSSTVKDNLTSSLDLTIDTAGALLQVGGTLNIDNTTFENNESNGGSALTAYGGALVLFAATTSIEDSTFTNNRTNSRGGAIDALEGTLTVINTTFDGNVAGSRGSNVALFETTFISRGSTFANASGLFGVGLLVGADSVATVIDSTITNNEAIGTSDGGGIVVDQGTLTLQRSTVYSNTASGGAGLYVTSGTVNLVNSTVSGNLARRDGGGGVLLTDSTATLTNSTVAFNRAEWPIGGTGAGLVVADSTLTLNGSVIVGNVAERSSLGNFGDQLYLRASQGKTTTVNSRGDNLVGQSGDVGIYTTGDGTIVNTIGAGETPSQASGAILDDAIALNGGRTLNHALVANSPAIDRVASSNCSGTPVANIDQRSRVRNVNGMGGNSASECDSGAFEYASSVATAISFGESSVSDAPNIVAVAVVFAGLVLLSLHQMIADKR